MNNTTLQPVDAKRIPAEQNAFNETWRTIKQYHEIQYTGNDSAWIEVLNKAETIRAIGTGQQEHIAILCKGLALLIVDYLEALSKYNTEKGSKEK